MAESIGTRFMIATLSLEGDHTVKPLLHDEKCDEFQPEISPSRKWLAYSSTESGQYEVYVRSFPYVNVTKLQVSAGGGTSPVWSPNERELFYLINDNCVMTTNVEIAPAFHLGPPKVVFKSIYLGASNNNIGHPWDVSPEGKRFLMMKPSPSAPTSATAVPKINIVVNWFKELKQRVPVK